MDRYAYVNNSPINYIDPSGHFTCSNDRNSDDYCPSQTSGGSNRPSITRPSKDYSNIDDFIDNSPQPDFNPYSLQNTQNGIHQQGCIYSGNGSAYCSDDYLYIISNEEKTQDFLDFLLSLNDKGINDVVREFGQAGIDVVLKKLGAELLSNLSLPYELIDGELEASMDEFTDSAVSTMYAGKGNDVLITSQTYFDNSYETEPYIQVSVGAVSSIIYNGVYTDDILEYLNAR